MLRLEDIHTFYGAIQALDGVSVEVNQGEIVTLIGSNGAGKTTLLMTICGSPRASQGSVVFDGQDIRYGLIDQPYTRERFEGGLGRARLVTDSGEYPLAVRKVDLAQATLLTTYPEVGTPAEAEAFRRVSGQVRLTRYGLDCYAYGLLALGQVDLVIEAGLQSYDIAGPLAVVQAAGGIVTDWQGGPAHQGGQVIAAASAELHRAALTLLNGGRA